MAACPEQLFSFACRLMKFQIGFKCFFIHPVDGLTHIIGRTIGSKSFYQFKTGKSVQFIDIGDPGMKKQVVRIVDMKIICEPVLYLLIMVIFKCIFDHGIFVHDVGNEKISAADPLGFTQGLQFVFFSVKVIQRSEHDPDVEFIFFKH